MPQPQGRVQHVQVLFLAAVAPHGYVVFPPAGTAHGKGEVVQAPQLIGYGDWCRSVKGHDGASGLVVEGVLHNGKAPPASGGNTETPGVVQGKVSGGIPADAEHGPLLEKGGIAVVGDGTGERAVDAHVEDHGGIVRSRAHAPAEEASPRRNVDLVDEIPLPVIAVAAAEQAVCVFTHHIHAGDPPLDLNAAHAVRIGKTE